MREWELQRDYSYYQPENDEVDIHALDDTRRKRITLRELNRLKHLKQTRNAEQLSRLERIKDIYGSAGGDSMM